MKALIVLLSLSLFAACSSTQQVIPELQLPELIVQYPLPLYPLPVASSQVRIDFKILVGADGSVKAAELLNGSGNKEWDTTAIATIKMWRYTPAVYQNKPVKLWLKQTAVVQFSAPQYVSLQEIVFLSEHEADSVYALLENGYRFEEMVMLHSVSLSRTQKGLLGKVNIQIYPQHVKKVLAVLNDEQFTPPVKFGDRYVIFKRVKDENAELLP